MDLDPLNNCEPVDCQMKYLGSRNFFSEKWKRCQKVPFCISDPEQDLPDVVYSPITNACMDMTKPIETNLLKKLERDNVQFTKNKVIRVNFQLMLEIKI